MTRPFPLSTDVHVHLAAIPHGDNGCHISSKMLQGPLFRFLMHRMGLPTDDPAKANSLYIERLVRHLKSAKKVRRAVLLAMDGIYDTAGVYDAAHTEFYISNNYLLEVVGRYPELFDAGVSINPQRRDALDELDRCAAAGAKVVKVLPNAQRFNPTESRYRDFYRRMAKHNLVLLSHVGYEFTLIGTDQSVGDPTRLRLALEEGVTVIAAHGASFGLFFYEKYWSTLCRMITEYPRFFWDASALTLPNRVGMLLRLRKHPELFERMVFGTDYPLPVFAYPALLTGNFSAYKEVRQIENPFDRQALLLERLGFPMVAA